MISVVPVRDGQMPDGGFEAIAEANGRMLVVESTGSAAALAAALVPMLRTDDVVIVPASPDGRDLAPHLASVLGRPLLAGAISVRPGGATLARHGGRVLDDVGMREPFVATLEPGSRNAPEVAFVVTPLVVGDEGSVRSIEIRPPDPATVDLVEAPRIVAGGAGLDGADRLAALADLAVALGASLGATRVVTDRGWVGHERQIGTTGVIVNPDLYLAFGVSGAVQHTGGLGNPSHIVSVNTDPHCPMMQLADLAIVADANAVIDELRVRIGGQRG
jgi:electron transfer flavoprotein alpha subunit